MRIGISALVLAYVLSQFYRAFLAVMTPVLTQDLGVSAADLASASGWWFLAFAAMQVPVGAWLDRVGPRLTTGVLLGLGAAGAVLFAQASGALQIKLAMALIDEYLLEVLKRKGSDLHFIAGDPPRVRRYEKILPLPFVHVIVGGAIWAIPLAAAKQQITTRLQR